MTKKGMIYFDLDDTLLPSTQFMSYARQTSLEAMINEGLDSTPEEAMDNFQLVYENLGANSQSHYNYLLKEVYNITDENEIARLVAVGVMAYHNTKPTMKPHLKAGALLEYLENDFELGIISSGVGTKQWEKIYRIGFSHFFKPENVLITETQDFEKTQPEFYSELYKKKSEELGTNNLWMVGDREDSDITPAKEGGFYTVRVATGRRNKDFLFTQATHKFPSITDLYKNPEIFYQ